MSHANTTIASHYTRSQWIYEYFWYTKKSLGMHCGLWSKNTKTFEQANLNQYTYIANIAKPHNKSKILDAGCGVGGGAIYFAKNFHSKTYGVSITPNQISLANKYSKYHHTDSLTQFTVQDYTKTNFPNNFFDLVFAIESICHSPKKLAFLKEAYRILKPGGLLIINDGYLKRAPINSFENELVNNLKNGWVLPEFISFDKMTNKIKNSKLKLLKVNNLTSRIRPTLIKARFLVRFLKPVLKMLRSLKNDYILSISENIQSLSTLEKGDRIGLFGYYSHISQKP